VPENIMENTRSTIDPHEVERFSAMAAEWWNPSGKFRPLHKFNPVRLEYIKRQLCTIFARDFNDPQAFSGLRLLDIGCGGGLLSEPMARLGAQVTGADPSATNIEIASIHAAQSGLDIDYRAATSGELKSAGESFDVILNMEVVEHVADIDLFISECAAMVRPGGIMFVATINRTLKAWALAIVAAENILRWLPRGTHDFEKLVTPVELEAALAENHMQIIDKTGVFYNPLQDRWNLSRDMDVNYMLVARKPEA
jgi:2-polyprenyl-6-hydroxyphenyl methylase / 3-demethylubiquinone-9 3-methyltransferase